MPNRYYTSHSEIQGYGDPALESASATVVQPGENKQAEVGGVFKDGLIVSGHIAQELSENPASEFYYFQSIQGTDQYHMKSKNPEEIADLDGTRIEFRKNINYFYKALGRSIIGDDGRVDLKNGREQIGALVLSYKNGDKVYQDALYQFIVTNGDVAEQDKKALDQFCHAVRITSMSSGKIKPGILNWEKICSLAEPLNNALVSMNGAAKLKEQREREGQLSEADQKKLKEYETEAENCLGEFRFWAGLDPESHQDMIINPDPYFSGENLEVMIDGASQLHPERPISYHSAKRGQKAELKKYCDDLEQFFAEDPEVWEELMVNNGILPKEFPAKKAEYEDVEKRRESLLSEMKKLQKSDMAMYEELLEAKSNLHGRDKEELEDAYEKSIDEVKRKIEADRKENPKLIPLNEEYMQLYDKMLDLDHKHLIGLEERKRQFRVFCNGCMNGDIALDEKDPQQKKLLEKIEVLKKRGINPAITYWSDTNDDFHKKADDCKVYCHTGTFANGIQVDVTIDGQKRNLAIEAPFYQFDKDKIKGFSRAAIGILKDDEEYRKYTVSGKLTQSLEAGQLKERKMKESQEREAYHRVEGYHLSNHLGIRELKSMSGEQLLARLTGVSETSPDRFDSYVQGLKGCMINGQSALHFLGMEDYAGGAKVNGDRKKEAYIAGMGDVIKERLLDQLKELEPGERQDRFTVTMAGKDGSCQPLKLHFEEEVRPPEREVTKPGTLWKAFHSKASIERRMNEYRAYQKQREAYEEYQRQKAVVGEYNKSSELSAGDAEFFRKREELERSVKESAPKAKKSAEKNVEYLAFSEFKDKEWESKIPAAQKNSKSVDMKKSEEKTWGWG